jgi:hypothetical protein
MLTESEWREFIDVFPTKSNKEVAKTFNITISAVESRQNKLRKKFGIKLRKDPITDYRIQKSIKNGKVHYYKRDRKKQNTLVQKYHHQTRAKVLARLGNKCIQCGFDDPRALQIDHINGNAKDDPNSRPQRGGMYTFRLAKMSDEELRSTYQLLCANCNWIKRNENKEW